MGSPIAIRSRQIPILKPGVGRWSDYGFLADQAQPLHGGRKALDGQVPALLDVPEEGGAHDDYADGLLLRE
jgi:hypothetical protein